MVKVEKSEDAPKIKERTLYRGLSELAELLGKKFASQFDGVTRIRKKVYSDITTYEFIAGERLVIVVTGIPNDEDGTSRVYMQYTTREDARVQRITINPRGLVKVAVGKSMEPDTITLLREELKTLGRPEVTRFRQR